MAAIGMRNIYFNKIKSEAENAAPTYETTGGSRLGALVSANMTLTYADGEAYADDKLEDETHDFVNGLLETELFDLTEEKYAMLFGTTKGEDGELSESGSDIANMGGLGYARTIRRRDAQGVMKTMWKGYFYPKVQPRKPTSENVTTKQSSVTYNNDGISFRIFEANDGYFRHIKAFATEAEYETWIKGKLSITA